jgi:hypothetical protein
MSLKQSVKKCMPRAVVEYARAWRVYETVSETSVSFFKVLSVGVRWKRLYFFEVVLFKYPQKRLYSPPQRLSHCSNNIKCRSNQFSNIYMPSKIVVINDFRRTIIFNCRQIMKSVYVWRTINTQTL